MMLIEDVIYRPSSGSYRSQILTYDLLEMEYCIRAAHI